MGELAVRPLDPDWVGPALGRLGEILFGQSPPSRREIQVRTFSLLIESGQLPRDSVLLAYRGNWLVGVILAELLPGGRGHLWPPRLLSPRSEPPLEDCLVQSAIQQLFLRGATSIQAVYPTDEAPTAEALLRNGFRSLGPLWTLRCPTSHPVPWVASDHRTQMVPAMNVSERTWLELLLQTYQNSLDYPELNETRLNEHAAEALYAAATDRSLWWVLQQAGESVGVLVLTRDPDRCDLHYLGVVPAFRRRGVASDAVRFALSQAATLGAEELCLLVDSRNQPAIQLYQRFSFQMTGSREVLLFCR